MPRGLALPLLWTLLIAVLSAIPLPEQGPETPRLLDVGHVASYALLAALWIHSLGARWEALLPPLATVPLTEVIQLPLPWRNATVLDLANNLVGVALGAAAYLAVSTLTQRRGSSRRRSSRRAP